MALTINSNILSLNAQRRFSSHSKTLENTYTRLSSGLRINKASDDAAGLAISSLLSADKRVTNQGTRNINDGVSYLNVAEGALNELTNIVTRIGELAEQASNGTLGSRQRDALQSEVTSLEAEYNRIIKTTTFNGNTLLTGLTAKTILQGGYGVQGQLSIQVGETSLNISGNETRAGLTARADTASDGTAANIGSTAGSISGDGRYIVFASEGTNLVSGDTNGAGDVFLKDTNNGTTVRVSTASGGSQLNGVSAINSASTNGRYILFSSLATNAIAGDTNGVQDVFLKDTYTDVTIRVSTSSSGVQANATSRGISITDDGRYVLFESSATNLVSGDNNAAQDVFIKDLVTGITTRASTSGSGSEGDSYSNAVTISGDGRYVGFTSTASNLVSGDTNASEDAFIKDLYTGSTIRISTTSAGVEGNSGGLLSAISSDFRYAVITSSSGNFVSGDTNGISDVYVKDIITGSIVLASSSSAGVIGDGGSYAKAISADGRFVLMDSEATNLSYDVATGAGDSFVKDMITGEMRRISVDNNGNDIEPGSFSTAQNITADGRSAMFITETGIVYMHDLSKVGVNEISGMVVSNQASARVTIDLAKKYLTELSEYRAQIGASLSRANTFLNTLQVQSENFAAAASQITDSDVAIEAANLTKTQILQQAAGSILAQANQQPSLALRLLGGI